MLTFWNTLLILLGGIILFMVGLILWLVKTGIDMQKDRIKDLQGFAERTLEDYKRQSEYVDRTLNRVRVSMINVRVIVRSNESDPLLIGKVINYIPLSKSENLFPLVLPEGQKDPVIAMGAMVPYTDEMMEKLEPLSAKEQWDYLAYNSLPV
jgi:hypothetical protein